MGKSVVVLCVMLATAACARASARLDDIEALLHDQPGNGRAIVEVLERLPLEERQTADYHRLLARACQAADQPGPAAEALATGALLGGAADGELAAVRAWLTARGHALARQAADARAAGDSRTALRAFLLAGKCLPDVLAEDAAVTEQAFAALDRAAALHPDRPAYGFLSGFLGYLAGQMDRAAAGFRAALAAEKDPYRAWRDRLWMQRVSWEFAAANRRAPTADAPSMDGLERTR